MLSVGYKLPDFRLPAVVSLEEGQEFREVSHTSYAGKWLVLFAWPMDFTFVCPTEIAEFSQREADFRAAGAQVLGMSTDTHYVHLAWRRSHPDLRNLRYPMLADFRRELSQALQIIHPVEGVAMRATFIVDSNCMIRFASANDLAVGRNIGEVLRVLQALKTGELTPCGWRPGEATLGAA